MKLNVFCHVNAKSSEKKLIDKEIFTVKP